MKSILEIKTIFILHSQGCQYIENGVYYMGIKTFNHQPSLKKTPWPQSASELYRPIDRRLSAKLVPTFLGIEGATWSA
jgi:hypothetical protein